MQEMRTVDPDEFARWLRAESRAHGNRLAHDPEALRPHFDLDRTVAVFEDGNIIGGSNSHLLEMSIPGGSSVLAGVSNVAVQPTHTRQGLMTRMLRYQFNDFHERGEPLSALFASESSIYGRFGYGVGSVHEQWKIERRYNAYARPYETLGRMVFIEPEDITKELPEVFRRSTSDRPGVFQRAPHKWEEDSQAPEHRQGGRGGLFYVAYEDGGRIEGYATYRTSGPSLTVNELMATTKEATAALWRFCFDVDLYSSTEALKRPVDDPLPWMLADPRSLQRTTRDGLWLRLIDVGAALKQRLYMESGRLVFEVKDDFCPWNDGRFELEGSSEGAVCRPSNASPDLAIAVSGLASAYLGAVSFTTLAGAGLADEHTPGALHRADRMFAVQHQPWTPVNF
jgi:predicted acetyltransferase